MWVFNAVKHFTTNGFNSSWTTNWLGCRLYNSRGQHRRILTMTDVTTFSSHINTLSVQPRSKSLRGETCRWPFRGRENEEGIQGKKREDRRSESDIQCLIPRVQELKRAKKNWQRHLTFQFLESKTTFRYYCICVKLITVIIIIWPKIKWFIFDPVLTMPTIICLKSSLYVSFSKTPNT